MSIQLKSINDRFILTRFFNKGVRLQILIDNRYISVDRDEANDLSDDLKKFAYGNEEELVDSSNPDKDKLMGMAPDERREYLEKLTEDICMYCYEQDGECNCLSL